MDLTIAPEVLASLPAQMIKEYSVIPINLDHSKIELVTDREPPRHILEEISFVTGRVCRVRLCDPGTVQQLISLHYPGTVGVDPIESIEENGRTIVRPRRPDDVQIETDVVKNTIANLEVSSPVKLADSIISTAIGERASDIHLEPLPDRYRIRYRIDGVLREVLTVPPEKARPLLSRLKILAKLDIAEKRRPQDGRIEVVENGSQVDIRISVLPTNGGEKLVLRILDKTRIQLNLENLGFEENDLGTVRQMLGLPFGMIIVTGPTGSGKTTTLYSALQWINSPGANITTIEDPIEYNLAGINQTQAHKEIGLTFASILRAILRQDPNVIMVGEIRDNETAEIAVRAALTGHLVLTTLHTNDAASAVTRLIDMGVEPYLVAASLRLIVAQRLLRRLCPECRRPGYPVGSGQHTIPEGVPCEAEWFVPGGCRSCKGIGYRGRVAAYEIFPVTEVIGDEISRGITTSQLRTIARTNGFRSLRESALLKARRGDISLEEVYRET